MLHTLESPLVRVDVLYTFSLSLFLLISGIVIGGLLDIKDNLKESPKKRRFVLVANVLLVVFIMWCILWHDHLLARIATTKIFH